MRLARFVLPVVFAIATMETTALTAFAQTSATKPLAESLTGTPKSDYEAAKLLYNDGDYAGALSKFKQSYEGSKDPRLLWNMAACEKSMRHYYRVQLLVRQYLEDGKGLLTSEHEAAAKNLLDAIKSFIATVTLNVSQPGATVLVDGQPVATTPLSGALPVDLGVHTITVKKPGFHTTAKEIDVAGGTEATVDLELRAEETTALLSIVAGAGDAIALDGQVVGKGRWEAPVSAGQHALRVTAAGKRPYERELEIAAGAPRTIQVTLENESKSKSTWLWIAGGAAVVAGVVVTGILVLQPDDKSSPQPAGSLSPGIVNIGSFR